MNKLFQSLIVIIFGCLISASVIFATKGDFLILKDPASQGTEPWAVFPACPNNQYLLGSSTASTGWSCAAPAGTGDMLAANNLSELTSTSTARTNLGVSATSSKTIPIVIDKIYTNQTVARNTWGNSTINYMRADFTGKTTCRSVVQVTVVGVAGARVQAQFATSSQTTWYQLDGSSATGATSTSVGVVSLGVANASSSAWVVTTSTFRGDVYLRISAWDGNGTADPAISAFVECF